MFVHVTITRPTNRPTMGVYILKKNQNIKTFDISFFEVITNAQIAIWTYVFTYKYLIGFKNIFTLNTKSMKILIFLRLW